MKKQIITLAVAAMALAGSVPAMAVPAPLKPVTYRQPGGALITIVQHGDEHSHYTTDAQGYPIELSADGCYRYVGADGALTGVAVGQDARRKVASLSGISPEAAVAKYLESRQPAATPRRAAVASKAAATGTRRVPVLLVEFADVPFTIGSKALFSDMLNKTDYNYDGATGSCHDYFKENSLGKFDPKFDVYDPVKLSKKREYYGSNDNTGAEPNLGEMVKEACTLLDDSVDFSQYDNDGDGVMDYVYVYYAGQGEHDTGITTAVWPQSSYMGWTTTGQFKVDGVTVDKFATSNELQANGRFVGMGIFVHEFCHVLDLPDLYATSYTGAFTPGSWSVLDHGPYNNESRTPPNLSAYERSELGWLALKELDTPADISMTSINDNVGYRISTGNPDEYFVVENRQKLGWDSFIPGHGMLVWHIDYDPTTWSRNVVNNNSKHQHVDIVEADGTQTEDSRAGDAFPGTAGVTSFTDSTTPAMLTWAGKPLGRPITGISESADGVISFKVMGGHRNLYAPTDLAADSVAPTALRLKWTPCADCDYQLLSVYTKDAGGNPEYLKGYDSLRLDNKASQITLTGLKPSTAYYAAVCSGTEYALSGFSGELEVTTLPPTFDMLAVVADPATALTSNGFTAHWQPLADADSYELSVSRRTIDGTVRTEVCDFTGKALPEGWSSKASSYFSAGGYYGAAAPALSLAAGGHYVQSRQYGEVRGISVWNRTMSYSSFSALKVSGFDGTDWVTIDSVPMRTTDKGAATLAWSQADGTLAAGFKAVRFELVTTGSSAGRLLLDDIKVDYTNPHVDDVVPGYDHCNVGSATSREVTGLENNLLYVYRVRGLSHGVYSRESNEVLVQLGGSGVTRVEAGAVRVASNGGSVSVTAAPGVPVSVITPAGVVVAEGTTSAAGLYEAALGRGVYVVRVGAKSIKVVL